MRQKRWTFVLGAFLVLVLQLTAFAEAPRWPRTIDHLLAKIVIYQPQVESFKGDKLTARAAVSVTPTGSNTPVFGALWVSARVVTDRDERTADLQSLTVTDVRFPDATEAQRANLKKAVEDASKGMDLTMSLDQLLTAVQLAEKEKAAAEKFNNVPPKMVLSKTPAVLVTIDGAPKLQKVDKTDLLRVVNTPFFIVMDPGSKACYLKAGEHWMTAAEPTGPWQITGRVPAAAVALAEAKDPSGLTGQATVAQPAADEAAPAVIVATEPTELVVLEGEPEFQTILGTNLLYVANTESDIFLDMGTQTIYMLISGRWYSTKSKEGPWAYVPPGDLPKDFSRIPPGSAKEDVRASVPETEEAREAVADTFIPQTAAVKRSEARLTVVYDGDPKFEPVEGTAMEYAVNTASAVVRVLKKFYCCSDAVWFESGAATGPWALCVSVPREIYTIPPSCHIYAVKYVYVYDSNPDVVYVGYTPGYDDCYVYGGCVVYGTGFVYRPWIGHFYYPRPYTWGFRAHYNPATGNWWAVGWAKGPNGWVIHGGGGHWNPVLDNRNAIADRGRNLYNNRADVIANRTRPADIAGRTTPGERTTPAGRPTPGERPVTPRQNDLFADRDGSVYRKGLDGWEKPAARPDTPVRPAPTAPPVRLDDQRRQDLDSQFQARNRSEQRTRQFDQARSAPRPSARPAPRGGGRMGR